MSSAGQLLVGARRIDGELRELTVNLQRPSVTRLFIGQLPDVVIKTVPYLFTLCAHAQRLAAQAAVNAALDETPHPVENAALWVEMLHENLWRLLLDWPLAVGVAPAREAFIAWRAVRHEADAAERTQRLIDETLRPLSSICCEHLPEAGDHAGACPSPRLEPAGWLAWWRGETTSQPPLRAPTSVLAAYRARLDEVDAALAALANGWPFPVARAGAGGWGVGQTMTARGCLTHAVHVDDGKVVRYLVQAPTDGLFANPAPLGGLLAGRQFVTLDQARQALDLAILALDPCLPYTLDVQDA